MSTVELALPGYDSYEKSRITVTDDIPTVYYGSAEPDNSLGAQLLRCLLPVVRIG